jgi:hypothetical protein
MVGANFSNAVFFSIGIEFLSPTKYQIAVNKTLDAVVAKASKRRYFTSRAAIQPGAVVQ